MTTVARVALTIASVLAGCALFAVPLDAPGHTPDSTLETDFQYAVSAADDASVAPSHTVAGGEAEKGAGAVDLYGNEVSDAVSTYRLDEAGSLYEVHSPQTELTRLASPES